MSSASKAWVVGASVGADGIIFSDLCISRQGRTWVLTFPPVIWFGHYFFLISELRRSSSLGLDLGESENLSR
ncbi:hypothetical protein AAC387_Pa01g2885 [Persea americana]